MVDPFINRTLHLERTSEIDAAPLGWAVAQLTRQLAKIPESAKAEAVLHGWRGARIEYRERRTDQEVLQERLAIMRRGIDALVAAGTLPREAADALIKASE